ncbi:MAG: AAA family ATPase, partial [Clostridium sp.]|nr:AAA family ATPase [Clostridium sp.]
MTAYKKRIVDEILEGRLKNKGAILIEGAKWCGKTTTAEKHAASVLYMSDPDQKEQNLQLAEISPTLLLKGAVPRLIDEWQLAPKLWDAVRYEVDHRDGFGHFLLTGSAVLPKTTEIHHTGTGRFTWLKMRPMSLWESGESNGEVRLSELFKPLAKEISAMNTLNLEQLSYLICRGGWPLATALTGEDALEQAFDYFEAVVKSDITRADGIKRDEQRIRRFMRSYARHQGTQTSYAAIGKDLPTNDDDGFSIDTVTSYANALRKIFVIEDMTAWNPNLRSKTAIRTSDTRYFVDPSIATAALG